ncbi:hypothetical protein [Entomospira culicis]|uniref:Uncharacterized protein n=1 Tax=Entomospira culicis TaxID=2719989 RepID=A0A968KUF1_9SPIO|nr:hypothetical protein [Entomospira culicis]NIZ19596.1 hypothetical protein [Entomospira culicis]NIZ69499.1 hypothetical protein [Entomospira culicis]WDI36614.1 hypothetical protein PVA46_04625 [Entomospira culicis]WDI38242.1 hypothetical protein PVA47_04635 [Entomospira culicis]
MLRMKTLFIVTLSFLAFFTASASQIKERKVDKTAERYLEIAHFSHNGAKKSQNFTLFIAKNEAESAIYWLEILHEVTYKDRKKLTPDEQHKATPQLKHIALGSLLIQLKDHTPIINSKVKKNSVTTTIRIMLTSEQVTKLKESKEWQGEIFTVDFDNYMLTMQPQSIVQTNLHNL